MAELKGLSLRIGALRDAYAEGRLQPSTLMAVILARIAAAGSDNVWISRHADRDLLARAAELDRVQAERGVASLPLFGVPFAVKDNIDVAGLPTSAACPAFTYRPDTSASAVSKLEAAGAIVIGKTNLDQFATGLVGVRSPYGIARNPFDPAYIPGGSSSGSAVAVASGLVSFALGTDTAGSGRVPAGINNIVGIKPSIGLIATDGLVPACRSLDCISIFSLTVEDGMEVLAAALGANAADAYSRRAPAGFRAEVQRRPRQFSFAVPRDEDLAFFGNESAKALFAEAQERLRRKGGAVVPIDFQPFVQAADFLYSEVGVAERTAAIGDFMAANPDALHPVTKAIVEKGRNATAVDLYRARERLAMLRQQIQASLAGVDFLLVPTAGTNYRIDEVLADPIRLNSNLGYYTNFVNLMDLCGIAVPAGLQPSGLPFGVTLLAPAFNESLLAGFAADFHAEIGGSLGATCEPLSARPSRATAPSQFPVIDLVVFGAHMRGEPLNGELLALGARFGGECRTEPSYRLFHIPGKGPGRPGLVRVAVAASSIEGEIWRIPAGSFAAFVAGIAPPLGIGTVRLIDGSEVLGFLCEAAATAGRQEISSFGGWRAYRAAAGA